MPELPYIPPPYIPPYPPDANYYTQYEAEQSDESFPDKIQAAVEAI